MIFNKQTNKLGISEYRLENIEKEIVKTKLKLIDEYCTFNEEKIEFKYLKKINTFLFCDLYYREDIGIRKISKTEKALIDQYLNKLICLCKYKKENKEEILSIMKKIWELQPFQRGNTRTLLAYLKVLNNAFLLNLDVDVNMEIISGPSVFNINNFVNQKRLTK